MPVAVKWTVLGTVPEDQPCTKSAEEYYILRFSNRITKGPFYFVYRDQSRTVSKEEEAMSKHGRESMQKARDGMRFVKSICSDKHIDGYITKKEVAPPKRLSILACLWPVCMNRVN